MSEYYIPNDRDLYKCQIKNEICDFGICDECIVTHVTMVDVEHLKFNSKELEFNSIKENNNVKE
nr:MAG TPA: hypothetical protein [Caudoviricetes sp.]